MKASIGRLWAIAAMTLVEASRRKVFAILVLFAVALLSSAAFFPSVEMKARLRLMEAWSLRAATLFTAIVALFVSGFSLPGDFETRRIYLLVTKPVSKVTVFLGRLLGFAMLLAVFLGIMGLVTVVFIRLVALLAGPSFPPLVAYPRLTAPEFRAELGRDEEDQDPPRKSVANAPGAALVWRYRGMNRADFPDAVRGDLRLLLGSRTDVFRASGSVEITASAPGRPPHRQTLFLQTHEEGTFMFPADLIGNDGAVELRVAPADADGWISGWAESLALFTRPANFELNFMKGLILAFFQSALVLAVTLTASTFLSAPVSILMGILLYIVGSVHSYAREGIRDIDRSMVSSHEHRGHGHAPGDIPRPVLRISAAISKVVLSVVPDFDRFDFSAWLLKDRAVSWRDLARAAFPHAAIQMAVLTALGMLVMRFKDFGQ